MPYKDEIIKKRISNMPSKKKRSRLSEQNLDSTKTLSVYLFQKTAKTPRMMLRDYDQYQRKDFKESVLPGQCYVKITERPSPASTFLEGYDLAEFELSTRRSGLVFIFKVSERYFAITFGLGCHMINPEAIVQDFGFRVTINAVDPNKISGVESSSFDANQRNTNDQTAMPAGIEHFVIEPDFDILKRLSGKATNRDFANKVSGRKNLRLTSRLSPENLSEKCAQMLDYYESNGYLDDFEWINNIQLEEDPVNRETLELYLCDYINGRGKFAFEPTLVATAPEWLDDQRVQCYQIGTGRNAFRFPELDWNIIRNHVDTINCTIERLKNIKIAVLDDDDITIKEWSLFRCLAFEVNIGDESRPQDEIHTLREGKWYRVCRDYLTKINQIVAGIPKANLPLGEFDEKLHQNENGYNRMTADASPLFYYNLDRDLVRRGKTTGVEACDLFTRNKQFVHVKRFSGSKSFAHMVAQGLVSGKAFASDRKFQEQLDAKLPERFKFNASAKAPKPKDYEIVFAYFRNQEHLPLFSKIVLASAFRQLRGLGYRISLMRLNVRDYSVRNQRNRHKNTTRKMHTYRRPSAQNP